MQHLTHLQYQLNPQNLLSFGTIEGKDAWCYGGTSTEEPAGQATPYVETWGYQNHRAYEVARDGIPGYSHLFVGYWRNVVSGIHNLEFFGRVSLMTLQADQNKFMRITVKKDGTSLVTRPLTKGEIEWSKDKLDRLKPIMTPSQSLMCTLG